MRLSAVPSELVTKDELARRAGCSLSTIDRMRRRGLPCVTVGRRLVRFDADRAIAWMLEDQG